MTGHTKWSEIKHKSSKKATALQVVVYDMTGQPLPKEVLAQVTDAVEKIVKQHDTLAQTVVTE